MPGAVAVCVHPFLLCLFHSLFNQTHPLSCPKLDCYILSSSHIQIIVIQLKDDNQDIGASTDSKYAAKNIKKDYENRVEGEAYITAEFDYEKSVTAFPVGDGKSYSRSAAGNTTRASLVFVRDNITA